VTQGGLDNGELYVRSRGQPADSVGERRLELQYLQRTDLAPRRFLRIRLQGNTIVKTDSTGSTSYTWDYENRMTSVILPGSGGDGQLQIRFVRTAHLQIFDRRGPASTPTTATISSKRLIRAAGVVAATQKD